MKHMLTSIFFGISADAQSDSYLNPRFPGDITFQKGARHDRDRVG